MGVKDIMKAYIFKVHFHYSDDVKMYVVSARSEDNAELVLLDNLYRKYLQCAKCDTELVGVCDTFYFRSNGESLELEEGDVVML